MHSRSDDFNFPRRNAIVFDQLLFNYRGVHHDVRAAIFENKRAALSLDRIGDTTRAGDENAGEKKRQSKPVVLRAVSLDQVDLVSAAKTPDPPRTDQVEAAFHRDGNEPRIELPGFEHNLTLWIAH